MPEPPLLVGAVVLSPLIDAVVEVLFTLLVRLNMLAPPPPNAVLLVTFLNTLFVIFFRANDVDIFVALFYCIIIRISITYIGRVVIVNAVLSKLAAGAFPAVPRIPTAPDTTLDAAVLTGVSSAMMSICATPVPLPPISHTMPP